MKYGKIITTDRGHDWHATVDGTSIWECAPTEDAAIGKLIKMLATADDDLRGVLLNAYYPTPENQ